ncbi:ABC transporter substrate-binding protein [Isoptericola jiangsuensis]|uniref:ABC transporter substrate-binding protein n=1 Tax=Isoptericola jiangsuensis TaxID=548579 RepID=UPI003AAC6222
MIAAPALGRQVTTRRRGAVALLVAGVLALTACTSESPRPDPAPPPSTSASAPAEAPADPCLTPGEDPGSVGPAADAITTSAGEAELTGYNTRARGADSTVNEAVMDRVLGSFWYWGADGTVCRDTEFGTYEVVSSDPLQVEYTIDADAVWSDGVPVTAADLLLDWATQAITTDGTVVDSVADGATALFDHTAGLTFGDEVPAGPQAASADAKEVRYEFERDYADWQTLVSAPLPAHVVAAHAGVTVDELVAAIQEPDLAVLGPAAEFWSSGWSFEPGAVPDASLVPSSGRYALADAGQDAGEPGATTLVANESYWGTPPATREITFRSTSADGLVRAVQDGVLDVVEPPASVENLTQLEQIGGAVTVSTGSTFTAEHLDFNFRQGVFADSLEAREAFAYCVPRRQIVDELVRPLDEDAVVMDAREVYPFEPGYDDVVEASYDGRFDDVDLDLAADRFAAAGLTPGTEVRISYPAPNLRRAQVVAAIKASCDRVGFDVVDAGDPDFYRSVLHAGVHDVALFGWVGSGTATDGAAVSGTVGAQNHGGYSDATVDEAWAALSATTDEAVQQEQTVTIEKQLWDTLFSIPLFAHPSLQAHRSDVEGVRPTAGRQGVAWSAATWVRTS